MYRETGGIHVVRGDYFKKSRTLSGSLVSYVEIDNLAALSVNGGFALSDFELLQSNNKE